MSKTLLEKFKRDEVVEGEVKLTLTKPLSEFDEDDREDLESLYNSGDPVFRIFASLFNAILTQGRMVFIITRRLMHHLVINDVNTEGKSVNTKAYKALLSRIIDLKYVARTREPTDVRAGLYELIDVDLLKVLGKNINATFLLAQKENTEKWYDSYEEFNKKDLEEDPIITRAKRSIDAKRRNGQINF